MQLETRALSLASKLLDLCYKDARIKKDGMSQAKQILESGEALKKFKEIVEAQGGDTQITSDTLKIKAKSFEVKAVHTGIIRAVNNYNLNSIAKLLGAPHNQFSGVYLHKKIGDKVIKEETIITFYSMGYYHIKEAIETLKMFPVYIIE